MEYVAVARNIKISPRKMRLVADGIKKQNLKAAVVSLSVMNKRSAGPIKKALESAMANATNNFNADKEVLEIKDIIIEGGFALKRFHYAGRGRSRPYKRRQSHVRVILTDKKMVEAKSLGKVDKKEEVAQIEAKSSDVKKAKKEGLK